MVYFKKNVLVQLGSMKKYFKTVFEDREHLENILNKLDVNEYM